MIFSLIIWTIICIIWIIKDKIEWDDFSNWEGKVGMCYMFSILFFFLTALIYESIAPKITYPYIEYKQIISLQDEVSASGHFHLGYGNVEGEMYYFFYVESQHGGVIIDKISGNVEIIEQDRENGLIVKSETKTKPSWFWSIPLFSESEDSYIIYVPKGTIKFNFNIGG